MDHLENQTDDQTVYALPRIGSPAPHFEAVTTHGKLRLDDYKGRWLILFSHPADFTPVCTTEFIAFQEIYPKLREMNTELLGLSIDSVYSHIAWVSTIEEKMGIKIEFPIIADLDREVSTRYGMLMPDESNTETVRSVFVIDENQAIRAIIYYPMSAGRNMDEFVRLVQSLQTTDKHGVVTPANWRPGDQVIVPPPKTQEAAAERSQETGMDCVDWFLCRKNI
ncbi:MAG: peroxiredoxin [Bacillaceae bacterium]|nr:peroxiredoxin [Bacillaceae bacterium]